MSTIGWVLILFGALLIRQVSKGRALNLPEDISDAFLALVSGDTDGLSGVLTRTGDAATPTVADAVTNQVGQIVANISASGLAAAAIKRGKAAKGYRWAATGPDYYDCSGLIWRACQDIGYGGSRFTTADIRLRSGFKRIDPPGSEGPGFIGATINDIVLWPAGSGGVTGHMGVITGPNKFYSARSPRSGISEASIASFRKTKPIYLRFTPPSSQVNKVENQLSRVGGN